MLKTTENVVVIPQEYETWQGLASLSRVRQLLSVGITKKAIAARFKVSVQSIDKAFARERSLAKKKAPADTDAATNPETGDSNGVSHPDITVSSTPESGDTSEGGL